MKLKHSGIIFDLDGTLVDTLEDIAASMNRALKLRGYPELPAAEYRDKVGWGIKRLAFLALPPEARNSETAALVAGDAAKFYGEDPVSRSRLYPGIAETAAILGQRKIKSAVLTNKPDQVARKVIAALFPPLTFNAVRGEIPGNPRKPDPSSVWELLVEMDLTPANIVFAGDSEVDMETAAAAGCFALGVSWGYRSGEALLAAGAKRVIERPEELLELFQGGT